MGIHTYSFCQCVVIKNQGESLSPPGFWFFCGGFFWLVCFWFYFCSYFWCYGTFPIYVKQHTVPHNYSYKYPCALCSQSKLFKTSMLMKFKRDKGIGVGAVQGVLEKCWRIFSYRSIREPCHGNSISCTKRVCNRIKLDKPFSLRMKEHLYKSLFFSVIILEVQFMKTLSCKIFSQGG